MQQNTNRTNGTKYKQNKMQKYQNTTTIQQTSSLNALIFYWNTKYLYFGVFVFLYFCILFYLYFVPFVFCCNCILLRLYFGKLYFSLSCLYFGIFAFCSICILFDFHFVGFVFCYICILEFVFCSFVFCRVCILYSYGLKHLLFLINTYSLFTFNCFCAVTDDHSQGHQGEFTPTD